MKKKTLLAIVLSIVMTVTFIPTMAFAADEPEVTAANHQASLPLDKYEIGPSDFFDEEDPIDFDYALAYVEIQGGDEYISSYDLAGGDEEVCDIFSELEYDSTTEFLVFSPRKAGTMILNVYGEFGSTATVRITVDAETIAKTRYDYFFDNGFYMDYAECLEGNTYSGFLYLGTFNEDYDDSVYWNDQEPDPWVYLKRSDFDGKLNIRYNGEFYPVKINKRADADGNYRFYAPTLPEMAWGDSFELNFTDGAYVQTYQVTNAVRCRIVDQDYQYEYTWTGAENKPTISMTAEVEDEDTGTTETVELVPGEDFNVRYHYMDDDPAGIGWHWFDLTPCGKYYFDNYDDSDFYVHPLGTTITKATGAKKAVTVKWKKQDQKMSTVRISGYQIQLATDSKFKKNKKLVKVSKYSSTSKTIKKLKAKKKYYVRIRTYYDCDGDTVYSKWSPVKTTKTK